MTGGDDSAARPPAVTFSEFVLGLGANAAQFMGSDGDPAEVSARADLVSAAQHIDILTMLQTKTRGNLEEDEQKLLDALLYDLRMRYLNVKRSHDERDNSR
ncbi:MAG: DUF1844 domain-containing protein [Myxococcota bacterium]